MTWRENWDEGGGERQMQFALPKPTSAVQVLLLINVAIFFGNFIYYLSTGRTLAYWLGLSLARVTENPFLGLLNFVSYQFTHSIGVLHILGNGIVLYFFGTMVEQHYGPRHLVRLYLLSGVAGGVFWLVFSGILGIGAVPVIGASGSAYGILTFAAFMRPHAEVFVLLFRVKLWVLAAFAGFVAIYNTAVSLRGGPGSVADAAHFGGAAFGAAWWLMRPWLQRQRYKFQAQARDRERGRELSERDEVDRVLAKVKSEGMASLTKRERKTLSRYSEKLKR